MAKFGQGFIQSLTQPGYSQGMFNLGTALGQAPAMAAEKRERAGMLAQIEAASGDPIKLAQLRVQVANTPSEKITAQQSLAALEQDLATLEQNRLNTQGQQSIAISQQVFASEPKPENLPLLLRSIEQLAVQTGNDPVQAAAGARAARQTALKAKDEKIKEGFTTAYYTSLNSPEANKSLLNNMRSSGFSDLALDLETKNENITKLRDTNIERQNENKPLTNGEIEKLKAQVALIEDEPTKRRYEAATDTLSVVASNAPKKAREKFGQLLIDIAKISPEKVKEEKESLLPDPTQDEINSSLEAIGNLRETIGDEADLGFITLKDETKVLIDDILDGDVTDDKGNVIDMDLNDLARVVAAQQKQNPEIKIDVAIKRAAESLVLGKKIGKKGATVSNDNTVNWSEMQQ